LDYIDKHCKQYATVLSPDVTIDGNKMLQVIQDHAYRKFAYCRNIKRSAL